MAGGCTCKQITTEKFTWFTWSSLLIILSRTSGNSSFKRERKIGRSCSIVASYRENKALVSLPISHNKGDNEPHPVLSDT